MGFTCARPELPVLSESDLIPETGPYNIQTVEEVTNQVSGEKEKLKRVRTTEKKYGIMKWHFMKPISDECASSVEVKQKILSSFDVT